MPVPSHAAELTVFVGNVEHSKPALLANEKDTWRQTRGTYICAVYWTHITATSRTPGLSRGAAQ